MNKLRRKLFRDLSASKGLFLAVVVVIFLGVAFFGASYLGYRNLKTSYDYSYERLHFADFTIEVVEAPKSIVEQLKSISGISEVTGRIKYDLPISITGEESKNVLGTVISLPSGSPPEVNDVKIEEGAYFEAGATDSIMVEKSFAEYHDLNIDDTLYLTLDDKKIPLSVTGIVGSPEYIWVSKSRQEIMPSLETFGVFFIPGDTADTITGDAAINEFCFLINERADSADMISEAQKILEPYGIMATVPRDEQPSYAALYMDLEALAEMAEVFPLLFLIVGAFATYMLLTRMVYNQRTQIGIMRALGYSRRQILAHYLSFALIIGILGATIGIVAGYFFSTLLTKFYVALLGLPFSVTEMGWIEWLAIVAGIILGILPCIIAGLIPAYRASRLMPAETMRTPPPTSGRRLLLERIFPFLNRLSFLWKIPLRNIFRNRRRSIYTIIGVTFGISLILVSASLLDAMDAFMSLQFDKMQNYDAQVNFAQPQPANLADEVGEWEGVIKAEAVLQIPSNLEYDDETYNTMVIGLSPDSKLYRLYSPAGYEVNIDANGILLSEPLRKTLGVNTDDTISVRSETGVQSFKVKEFVKQPLGSFGYISLEQAQEMAGGLPVISSLNLEIKTGYMDEIEAKAYAIPDTASIEVTTETYEQYDDLLDLFRGMMWVMLGFGALLALAIVFTTITISILERRREIATMRTLGESKRRIGAMITVENILLGVAGIIPGICLGYALAVYFISLYQNDMFTLELVIFPRTYVLTVGLVILIMLVSQIPSIRNSNRIDLAKETKIQD